MKIYNDEKIDAKQEIKNLLEYNAFAFEENEESFCAVFSASGYKWITYFTWEGEVAFIISVFPFNALKEKNAINECNEINKQLMMGSLYVEGGKVFYRCAADLFDGFYSYEAIGRALEYNCAVVCEYFEKIKIACQNDN